MNVFGLSFVYSDRFAFLSLPPSSFPSFSPSIFCVQPPVCDTAPAYISLLGETVMQTGHDYRTLRYVYLLSAARSDAQGRSACGSSHSLTAKSPPTTHIALTVQIAPMCHTPPPDTISGGALGARAPAPRSGGGPGGASAARNPRSEVWNEPLPPWPAWIRGGGESPPHVMSTSIPRGALTDRK